MNKLEETNNNGANDNSTDDGDNASDTAFENPVIKIFRGFPNLPHNVIGKIRDCDVKYKDLSALCDMDLELFGIEDEAMRREIIIKLSNTPNQSPHYDTFIEEMNATKYRDTVYRNVRNQLQMLNMAWEATQKTLKVNPIKYDKLVDDNVHISELNTKSLMEMLKIISRMTQISQPRQWTIWMYSIAGFALLSSFAILRKIL